MVYGVDRRHQDLFCVVFEMAEIDSYGYYEGKNGAKRNDEGGFENDVFLTRPYDWSWDSGDDEQYPLPNFEYKPTGYKLWWYKYPLRAAEANQDLNYTQIIEMMKACMKSLL